MINHSLFEEQRCKRVLARLDSYVDGELLTETNLELLQHFQSCANCAAEAETRARLRLRLRTAVRDIQVPANLEARVRAGLREARTQQGGWSHRVMALAACLALCFGAWMVLQLGAVRSTAAWRESYVASVTNHLASIMRVGLGNHLHCSVFGKFAKQPPALESLLQEMAPEYRDLVEPVREKAPEGMPLMTAHQCRYHGRRFVHLAFLGKGQLLSLIITRKNDGESLDMDGLVPVLSAAGVPVYAAGAQKYHVAAFETAGYLVYTVSDLPRQKNMDVMVALAPAVTQFLKRLG